MPVASTRITRISKSDQEGWEVYLEACRRLRAGRDILMVAIGDHDFSTPIQTVEACKNALDAGHHGYTAIAGIPELRAAMARVSEQVTGVSTSPQEVIATPGGQGALYGSIFATMNDKDHGIAIGPYYVTYPGTYRASSGNFTIVDSSPENGFQPDMAAVEAEIRDNTKTLLINSPNNPTGVIYTRDTIEAICALCKKYDLWLLSDEVYWSLSGGAHISPRSVEGMADRTLVINSMSKSHGMTGWRVGWVTGPEAMIQHLTQLNLVSTYGISDFISRAATQALQGKFGVDEIAVRYASRRKVFVDHLSEIPNIAIVASNGGIYVMVDVRSIEPDGNKFAMALLDKENLAVMPGESFGQAAAGHLRISLCQPKHKLVDAANRIARLASTYSAI